MVRLVNGPKRLKIKIEKEPRMKIVLIILKSGRWFLKSFSFFSLMVTMATRVVCKSVYFHENKKDKLKNVPKQFRFKWLKRLSLKVNVDDGREIITHPYSSTLNTA